MIRWSRITSYNVCYTKLLRFVKGLYPDVIDKYAEKVPEYDAQYFLEMKEAGLQYFTDSEVSITSNDLFSADDVDAESEKYQTKGNLIVITSYSIHYTKLYDNCPPPR